jgi:hypothetical protein
VALQARLTTAEVVAVVAQARQVQAIEAVVVAV